MIPARDVPMDGALVYSCDMESTAVDWLMRRKLPLVFVDQVPAPGIPSINIDDRSGARAAAQHLVDLGHRRVDIVTENISGDFGIVDDPSGAARTTSSSSACSAGSTPFMPQASSRPWCRRDRSDDSPGTESGHPAARRRRSAHRDPVLQRRDRLRRRRRGNSLGLSVPDDLSVVGFDDNPLAKRMRPH